MVKHVFVENIFGNRKGLKEKIVKMKLNGQVKAQVA